MHELVKRGSIVGGLLAVPFLAVLIVSFRHDQVRSETPVQEPPPSGSEAHRTTEPQIPRVPAAPVPEAPAAAPAAEESQPEDRTEADIERTERAIASLKQMRQLVAEGRIPSSSMTSVEHIDDRIKELESGQVMPDPTGVRADPRARERARALFAGTR